VRDQGLATIYQQGHVDQVMFPCVWH